MSERAVNPRKDQDRFLQTKGREVGEEPGKLILIKLRLYWMDTI